MRQYLILLILSVLTSCATSKSTKRNQYIYWINSAKVPCQGVGKMQCFLIQKGDTLNYNNWQYFYTSIDGFEYQPGFVYKLIVREDKIDRENIPADASSIKYTMVKMLEKQEDTRLRINDIWVLESINGNTIQKDPQGGRQKIPQIEINVAEMTVMGNDGCNNFSGSIKKLEAEAIEFGVFAATKMACMGTDIPDKFNAAIYKTSKYKIENMKLFFYDNSGNKLMSFNKID